MLRYNLSKISTPRLLFPGFKIGIFKNDIKSEELSFDFCTELRLAIFYKVLIRKYNRKGKIVKEHFTELSFPKSIFSELRIPEFWFIKEKFNVYKNSDMRLLYHSQERNILGNE
jgi:hypothetical protein